MAGYPTPPASSTGGFNLGQWIQQNIIDRARQNNVYGIGQTPASMPTPQRDQTRNEREAGPSNSDLSAADNAFAGQVQDPDGSIWNVNKYGRKLSQVSPGTQRQPLNLGGIGGSGGPTWYEQQQIALDKQRLADAEAQQGAARKLAESQSIEGFNKDFRDFQAKSLYGGQYGPTYFSPAGSVFAQRAPESATLKEAFANTGQPDPWQQNYGTPAGYTGSTYSNAQHPGLMDWGAPQLPFIPQAEGPHAGLIAAIDAHPNANQYALSLPGVKETVQALMGGQTSNGGS